jgi:hypothetical protein
MNLTKARHLQASNLNSFVKTIAELMFCRIDANGVTVLGVARIQARLSRLILWGGATRHVIFGTAIEGC